MNEHQSDFDVRVTDDGTAIVLDCTVSEANLNKLLANVTLPRESREGYDRKR